MFLDPVKVGVAGREVQRSPRGGAAGLEPRRITGEGRGGTESWLGARKAGKGGSVDWVEGAGSAAWGKRREKQTALLRTPGRPARPAPPARSRRQLANCWNSAGRERAPYIERPSAAATGRACRGRGQNADPTGVSRQRRPSARGRQAPSWPLIGRRQFFSSGGGGRGLGAGQAAAAPSTRGGVESSAQMGAVEWRRVDTAPLL